MSRFHFDESAADTVSASLSEIRQNIGDSIALLNSVWLDLYDYDGFNIGYAIESLKEEINKIQNSVQKIDTGKRCFDDIGRIVRLYTGNATIVDVANNFIDSVMDNVSSIKKDKKNEVTNYDNLSYIGENTEAKGIYNCTSNLNIKNNGYNEIGFGYDDSNKSFRLFKSDGSDFEKYCQNTQSFDYGENPCEECTSTALAQCSNINDGNDKQAKYYNDYGITQMGCVPVNKDELYNYCVTNLEHGKATVIYYNYIYTDENTRWGKNGHAVTVIGVSQNSFGFTDLLVIDPSDGQTKYFGECNYGNGNTMYGYKDYTKLYIGYESNPRGAATKLDEINEIYPSKRPEY